MSSPTPLVWRFRRVALEADRHKEVSAGRKRDPCFGSYHIAEMTNKQPGTGPARKRKQQTGSHCSVGSSCPNGPSSQTTTTQAAQASSVKSQNCASAPSGAQQQPASAPPRKRSGSAPVVAAGVQPAPKAVVQQTVVAPTTSKGTGGMVSSKTGLPINQNTSQPAKKNVPMSGNAKRHSQPRQARDAKLIEKARNECTVTDWYLTAVKRGFKNQAALDRFNATVATVANDIDPRQVPVCMECGNSDVALCTHYVVDGGVVAVDDNAIAIPTTGGFFMRWRFQWFERVRKMFVWPRFDSSLLVNHHNAGFDPSVIPDTELWPEMLCYIRLHLHTEYKIDGVFNRAAKLAHCKKLANRFLTDNKIKLSACLEPEIVNKIQLTVARACDQRDDQTLFKKDDPRRNFWIAPGRIPVGKLILAATIISPPIVASLVSASLRMKFFVYGQLVQANAAILADGSVQAFRFALSTTSAVTIALARSIWSGLVVPCLTWIQQSSCKAVDTMSTNLSTSAISSRLQTQDLTNLTCGLSGTSPAILLEGYAIRSSLMISSLIHRNFSHQSVAGCAIGMLALTRNCSVMVSNWAQTVRFLPSSN